MVWSLMIRHCFIQKASWKKKDLYRILLFFICWMKIAHIVCTIKNTKTHAEWAKVYSEQPTLNRHWEQLLVLFIFFIRSWKLKTQRPVSKFRNNYMWTLNALDMKEISSLGEYLVAYILHKVFWALYKYHAVTIVILTCSCRRFLSN